MLFFANILRRTWLLPSVGLALLVLSSILLGLIVAGRSCSSSRSSPDEPDKEGPYIKENIEATRAAYDLDDDRGHAVRRRRRSPPTASSRRSTTRPPASGWSTRSSSAETFEQHQQVRGYYSVPDVLDVDRYKIDGKDRDVVLGVRELDQNGLADGDQNWANLHTVYTHGYGVIAAYGNQRPSDDARPARPAIQWAEGQDAAEGALTDLTARTATSRASTSARRAPTYSIVGKAARRQRPSSSTCREGDRSDDAARRRRTTARPASRSATSSTSCSTP